jgi:tetratricopeptide (TPR) repeat protein
MAATEEARRAFERALEIDPRSVDAKVGIAMVLLVNLVGNFAPRPDGSFERDSASTEQLLLEAIDSDPNDAAAHPEIGLLRRVQNRLTESRIEFERAISLGALYMGSSAGHYCCSAILTPGSLLNKVDRAIDLLINPRAANPRLAFVARIYPTIEAQTRRLLPKVYMIFATICLG